jgi:probable F420-dependent oxidoreductase
MSRPEVDRAIRVGAIVPNAGPLPGQLGIGEMAAAAESAGAASVWVSDHLLMLDADVVGYPYSADGRPTWPVDIEYYEAFVCCTLMAAATSSCRIGTAALVLPQRNVLEVAKVAASLDRLTGGRLVLGVGTGWHELEMEALGYEFRSRGKRFDEALDVLHDCWSGHPAPYRGDHVTVPEGVVLSPRPAQQSGPPLLVAGMSNAGLRRAATRGDGWLAIAFAQSWASDAIGERLTLLANLVESVGRVGQLQKVLKLHARLDDQERVPALVGEAWALGFDEIIVEPPWELGIDVAQDSIASVVNDSAGHP